MKIPDFELVSFPLCPFVQRTAITLLHKKVPFRTATIDLASPPEWFLAISPLGKVPLLRVREGARETVLFESAVINEYVDEITPPLLRASTPLERARERAWIEVSSELLMKMYEGLSARDLTASQHAFEALWRILAHVETALHGGDTFRGKGFSLVDAAYAPLFQRLFAVRSLHAHERWDSLPKARRWAESLVALPETSGSVPGDFTARFAESLARRGSDYAQEVA